MLSAALLTVASIEAIFFIDVVTAAIAVAILLRWLHVPAHERAAAAEPTGYFADLRAGLAYIAQHRYLKAFFLFNAVFFMFLGPMAFLTPLQVARSFGEEVWRLSAIEVGFSFGMVVGGALMASWGGFSNRIYNMVLANFINGVCALALGLPPAFSIYVLLMTLIGVIIPMFNTPATVMLHERVEGAYLGRIFGVHTMIASSLMPLSMLIYGPLADIVPIERLLVISGGAMYDRAKRADARQPGTAPGGRAGTGAGCQVSAAPWLGRRIVVTCEIGGLMLWAKIRGRTSCTSKGDVARPR